MLKHLKFGNGYLYTDNIAFTKPPSMIQPETSPKTRRALSGHLFATMLCIACMALGACAPNATSESTLTYTTARRPFTITVDAEGVIEAQKAQTVSTPRFRSWRQLEILELMPEGSLIKKGDVVVRFDPQPFENDYLTASNTHDMAQAESKKKEAELTAERLTLQAEMQSAEASAAVSRLQVAKLEFVAPRLREVKRLEMKLAELKAEKIRKKLASIDAIQKEERASQKIKINQAKRKMTQAEEVLAKLNVEAPGDGMVVHVMSPWQGKKPQVGASLYPSEPVIKIPDLSVMQVKMQVGEIPAQKLKKDQRAEIVVSSLEQAVFTGKITRVAKRAKPVTRNSKVKQVEVIVQIDSARADVVPGLSARVRVFVEERPDALVVPLDCVFKKDSTRVVYLKQGRAFVSHEVDVIAQNANFAVLEADIADGIQMALQEPKEE